MSSPLPDVALSQNVCVRAVAEAVGAAAPFIKLDGKLPAFVMVILNEGPADHIRKQAYKYAKLLKSNSNMSARIKKPRRNVPLHKPSTTTTTTTTTFTNSCISSSSILGQKSSDR